MKLDETDIKGVAKFLANHSSFRGKNYEQFAEKVFQLVKKYGVSNNDGYTDYDLGAAIWKSDEGLWDFFTGIEIGRLLWGNGELTEEQKMNRARVKGELNV